MFDFSNITEEGLTIALVGYFIVFAALVLLFLVFNNLPRLLNFLLKPSKSKIVEKHEPIKKRLAISGEVNAAISTALILYFEELHDEEETILTINKVSKSYSPWNSKIYGTMGRMMLNHQKK